MYRDAVDQATQHDIAAAAAAHHELGRDYDNAVAESLVDRIGSEIDKRVDAKLAARDQGRRRPAEVTPADRRRALWLGIGIGSAATGITAITVAAATNVSIDNIMRQLSAAVGGGGGPGPTSYNAAGDMLAALVGVWGLLVVIYIVYAWVRHARGQER
jgi:hypothetical protein